MIPDDLNNTNFMIYAIKSYNRPLNHILDEFSEDIQRLKYIKRLLRKYKENQDLKERLILNHIIILYNVFGAEAVSRILFQKIDKEFYPQLKTFLLFLHLMPTVVYAINGTNIVSADIPLDLEIAKRLKSL